jgi:hypothetical protein
MRQVMSQVEQLPCNHISWLCLSPHSRQKRVCRIPSGSAIPMYEGLFRANICVTATSSSLGQVTDPNSQNRQQSIQNNMPLDVYLLRPSAL